MMRHATNFIRYSDTARSMKYLLRQTLPSYGSLYGPIAGLLDEEKLGRHPVFSRMRKWRDIRRADKSLQEALEKNQNSQLGGIIAAEYAVRIYQSYHAEDRLPKAMSAWRIAHLIASQIHWEAAFRRGYGYDQSRFLDRRMMEPEKVFDTTR